jgi:hypothetical protein
MLESYADYDTLSLRILCQEAFSGVVSLKHIFSYPNSKFLANYHLTTGQNQLEKLSTFGSTKSDALVGCLNTFIILHTKEFKIAFKIRNL